MATSLVGGMVAEGTPPDTIWVTDTVEDKLVSLQERFQVRTSSDNRLAVSRADTVVLAVKPQTMEEAIGTFAETAAEQRPLIVSIAAGVRESAIHKWLGYDAAIVRTMPNTPALVGEGATALFANDMVSAAERSRAEGILSAVGLTLWVESETQLDAVTAVSGSGPAYYFLLMELMEKAGEELGLDREVARQLTLQTALGAAKIAIAGEDPPATLRERVTSPGGTTEQALLTFADGDMEALVKTALTAARDRSIELGNLLGDD